MPRRFQPRGSMVDANGRLNPQWEFLLRDLVNVPEFVRATEQRTLRAALAPKTIIVVPTVAPPDAPAPAVVEQTEIYQISYYARIVEPATVSSSLTVTVTWVEQGVTQTYVAPAITGNTTASVQQDTGRLITADAGTEVTVDTSYTSVGADDMAYDLDVAVEPTTSRGGALTRE